MRTSRTLLAATATLALAATGALVAPADAGAPAPKTLAKDLVGPLRAAVDSHGTAYVSQNFGGPVLKVKPGKAPKAIYSGPAGVEVGGLSRAHGALTFTQTVSDDQGNPSDSSILRRNSKGKVRTIANIWDYEAAHNPDGGVTYGVRGISDECAAQWPTDSFGPPVYTGVVDSHPYATVGKGWQTYVADAAMNAIISVSPHGRIKTVSVLPPVAVPITSDLAAALGAPDCAVGMTYYGESVPTDVEVGPGGMLYVTTLGGGLGEQLPLGAIYRVNPHNGHAKRILNGLSGPVGLAIAPHRTIYFSQLFGGSISKVKIGSHKVRTFVNTALPAEVEYHHGSLYATINALPPDSGPPAGKLVRYRL
jgi:hypothetical protein